MKPRYDSLLVWALGILPFYLPLAVWAASNFGSIYIFSAWKELIMIALICTMIMPILRLLRIKDDILRYLFIAIAAYVLLSSLYIVTTDNLFEFGAGLLLSTRFLIFFVIAFVLAQSNSSLPKRLQQIVVMSGVVLAGIALMQALLLPPTILQHIGYEPLGVETPGFPPAVTTLGEVDDFVRPQATLRGPNPLGAFFVLPFCLLAWKLLANKKRDERAAIYAGIIGLAMLFTFSRSAWLAAAIGTIIIATYVFRDRLAHIKKGTLIVALITIVLAGAVALTNKTVRVVVLREEHGSSVRLSDDIRSSLTKEAWADVVSHPFGRGPGNAGPVSVLDNEDRGRIAENYFLQVAQETGWLGLTLFVGIHILLLKKLWSLRNKHYALVALATLCGLIVANLTLHTWSDEAVSILWWSFAGSAVGAIVSTSRANPAKRS